ncbi:GNAT family N-acetyltransferase [Loktanella sp. D2R18]|uniref:GNAT family N-acetyltransferase n=1 Tax=Rhodobacterales TaxID=204455 RepID=UPI000DEB0F94|nr:MULTISPECIES: GNAT family N-acetyltransferase [Rhodobacterales]MDO6590811.1 GNAT family N-acetyltransferase [Yoonia sp. 1_MG-2023]RBW43246.1 GNAT family N-acetyltransferase [Loktanella sp. D2R18]
MIRARHEDRAAIESFLTDHIATSMFPLSNLRDHGMAGGHPRAVTFWVRWKAGKITDVVTVTDEGFAFPQCPTWPWGEVRVVLAGQALTGILGDAGQVVALRDALGWTASADIDEIEPLYQLKLTDLRLPDCTGYALRPLAEAPRDTLQAWRVSYLNETGVYPGESPEVTATKQIAEYIQRDSHRALYRGNQPIGMTGFNAQLPQVVQIGGVFTPDEFRGQGVARRAVGLHLKEARENGVKDAILFAASDIAARAYEAIGFENIGAFAMMIYRDPQVIHV